MLPSPLQEMEDGQGTLRLADDRTGDVALELTAAQEALRSKQVPAGGLSDVVD